MGRGRSFTGYITGQLKRPFAGAWRQRGSALAAVLATGIICSVAVQPVSAAGTFDKSVVAGAQQAADTTWLANVSSCNRHVTLGGVDSAGRDGSNNTTQAWRTIKYGVSRLTAGDTLCVGAGTYNESWIQPVVTGTAADPIAVKAATPRTVTVRPVSGDPNGKRAFFDFNNNTTSNIGYWLIEGLDMNKRLDLGGGSFQTYEGAGINIFGSGQVHHIAIRNNHIMNSMSGGGVYLEQRAHNILIRDNHIYGHQRWGIPGSGGFTSIAYTKLTDNHRRIDANGITLQGSPRSSGGNPAQSLSEIRIENNDIYNNGGDAIQCLGATDTSASVSDPTNIDIVDNRMVNTPGLNNPASDAIEENGVDIKSCKYVSIRNTTDPLNPPAHRNKIAELLPTTIANDADGNNSDGTAIVVHYYARGVLIENTRMWNVCGGISVGRTIEQVQDLIIRRNLIFSMRYNQGTPADAGRCHGRALTLSNVQHADIYHNTLTDIPQTGIQTGSGSSNIDVWNNIFVLAATGAAPQYSYNFGGGAGANIDSDYNLFWHASSGSTQYFRDAGYNGGSIVTLAQWRTSTQRDLDRTDPLGSHWANPLFVANPSANDYYTQSGSLARDGALNNTGASFCGANPDIGFLESC